MDHHSAHVNKLLWESPSHPYRQRTAYEWREIIIRVGIVILAAVFFKLFLFAATIVAVLFIVYIFSTIIPSTISHKLDSNGVTTQGVTYVWEELNYCYFTSIYGHRMLVIISYGPRAARLVLPLGDMEEEVVHNFIEGYLPIRHQPAPSGMEKVISVMSRMFALD